MSQPKETILVATLCWTLIGLGDWCQTSAQEQAGTSGKPNATAVTMTTGQGNTMTLTI